MQEVRWNNKDGTTCLKIKKAGFLNKAPLKISQITAFNF
jgi:hypothetical protein